MYQGLCTGMGKDYGHNLVGGMGEKGLHSYVKETRREIRIGNWNQLFKGEFCEGGRVSSNIGWATTKKNTAPAGCVEVKITLGNFVRLSKNSRVKKKNFQLGATQREGGTYSH